ncbi:hypothetical protein ADEAN_000052100 [Angomonas deanei]|uniref:Uncharacterized protein n=1 Tax=Angomonas deanei TaxID=59799 RepID=A0A7G2C0N1_9TRYP|nr:hypothetical protein ADEAN_000052100 [Angomonas deanei]
MSRIRKSFPNDLVQSGFDSVCMSDEDSDSVEHYTWLRKRVERLQAQVEEQDNAIRQLKSQQKMHMMETGDTFDDIESYVEVESSLNSTIGTYLLTRQKRNAARKPPPQVTLEAEGVKEVLLSYKNEIIRQKETYERNLEKMQARIAVLEAREVPTVDVDAILQVCRGEMMEGLAALRTEILEQVQEGQSTLSAAHETNKAAWLQEVEALKAMSSRLEQSMADTAAQLVENITKSVSSLREEVTEKSDATQKPVEQMKESIRTLQQTVEELREAQEKAEEQRRNDPTPPVVQDIQKDMEQLKKKLKNSVEDVNRLKQNHPLDGAVSEIKDWLDDLDKRSVSRGELIEIVSQFQADVASLREEMNKI